MRNITKFDAEVITDFHPLFRALLWVSTARSKDDERFILQHVHIERDALSYHIVATDGKRMHVGTFDPGMFDDDIAAIAPGDYEVVAKAAKKIVLAVNDEAGNYPDWRALMPEDLPVKRDMVTRASISRLGIRSGVCLATDFVLEACGFGCGFGKDDSVSVEFASEREGGPFLIQHELGKAIVMPLRMDSDADTEAAATAEIPGALEGLTSALAPGESVEISMGGEPLMKIEQTEDGPRIVDAEEGEEEDGYQHDMAADVEAAAKVLVGKSAKDKKHAAIDKVALDWGAPGLKAVLVKGGDKIAPVFAHHIGGLIVDIEMREAEESQPEGESDY